MIKDEKDVRCPIFSSSKLLPASATVAEACSIPFGFLYDPTLQRPDKNNSAVFRCTNCKSYICKFSSVRETSWRCVFCRDINELPDETITKIPTEYLQNESYSICSEGTKPLRMHAMFIIDDYLTTEEKLTIFTSITTYLETAPAHTLVSIILLSGVVNVFMCGKSSGQIESEVFSGSMTHDLNRYLTFHSRDMICNLSTSRASLIQMIRDICHGLECKSQMLANNPFNNRKGNSRIDKGAPKCLGFMFELILSILGQDTKLEAVKHLVIFTGGELPTPNLPNSARIEQDKQYFASLGVALSKSKAAAHVHCIGNAVYGIEKMEAMVENCGGSIVWQDSIEGDISKDITQFIESTVGTDCVIRLQTTTNVTLTKMAGQAEETSLFTKRYPILTQNKKFYATFGISKRINTHPVFLQCTNTHLDTVSSAKVTHVTTIRYDCVVDHEEIMSAMCPQTVFTLTSRDHLMSLAHRKERTEKLLQVAHHLVTSSETAVQDQVKARIEGYLELVYFMLHGPTISRMIQQRDLEYYIFHLLSRGGVTEVSHLIKPKLYLLTPTVEDSQLILSVSEYPPVTLALRSERVFVVDTYTQVVIWAGAHIKEKRDIVIDQAKVFVKEITCRRYPKPSVTIVHDETASNRFVECYLLPLHKDPLELQLSVLPELTELCLEDHGRLVSKFKHMQNKSFYQWLEEIRLIVTSSAEF